MKKLKKISILFILLSLSACNTAKQMCLDSYNCYHKTNKEKSKYCNYLRPPSTVNVYKKYLKGIENIKNQLIVIENDDWYQGKYYGTKYIFFKDGEFDKVIRADKGNIITRKIKDETAIFLSENTKEEIKFYLFAFEYLELLTKDDNECNIEITDKIFEKVNEYLGKKTDDEVYFGGLNGSSTIIIFNNKLSLVKQYYSPSFNVEINIFEKLEFDFKKN